MAELIFSGDQARLALELFADRFGPSIFTTMASITGKISLWPRHYARLQHHCQAFGYHLPTENKLLDAIERNACVKTNQKIRVLVAKKNHAFSFEEWIIPSPKIYEGVSVYWSSIKIDEQWQVFKSTNRKPYELALKEAQAKNCFEALLTDKHGNIIDGARTSPLIFEGQNNFIQPLGGLESVMRAEIINYLEKNGFTVKKTKIQHRDVTGQILLCNSLLGVIPVGPISCQQIDNLVKRFVPPVFSVPKTVL